ncbi:MAG: hypothetical protein II568_02160, partial [Erysipelotrichaceae bacterium]|nr:hypothetical protein [Erysipelotrichaceae bacterium]
KILSDDDLSSVAGGASSLRVIGRARVVTTNLNIRSSYSKNSRLMGQTNEPASYDVYEIVQNEGYIWYRIDADKWIANDGTWVVFTSK